MFGCLSRIGCLMLVAVLAVAGWFTRDAWWTRVTGRPAASARVWTPVEPAASGAVRGRVEALGRGAGASFTSLTPAEVGALILGAAGGRLPPNVERFETAIVGEQVALRAQVDLRDLRSVEGVGPLRYLLTARQRVTLTGRPVVVAPGRGAFLVDRLDVGPVEVPAPLRAALLRQLDRGQQPSGEPGSSISFSLPRYVGDIRVTGGRVILYKSTP